MRRAPEQMDMLRTFSDVPREPERAAPYQPASQSSKAAARAIQSRSTAMRQTVYTAIVAAGEAGITRRELEGVTGFLCSTLCARLNELEEVRDIRKMTRLNSSNEIEVCRRDGCSIYTTTRTHKA